MALERYRQMRDFERTPEPVGEDEAVDGLPRFVIQKHDATRLHFDFRLEIHGVLVSWAVPKGPSVDPSVRRLAIRTEDHPLSYRLFEGVIPKGQYGAGPVMVWDRGTWKCPDDPAQAVRDGRIDVQLQGERLQGRWKLFRTSDGKDGDGEDDAEEWLMVCVASAQTGIEEPVARFGRSVLSGRTFDEIRRDAIGHGSIAPAEKMPIYELPAEASAASLPDRLEPQLPTRVDEAPTGIEWLHELKYDGYRVIAFVDETGIVLRTRNGHDWTDRFRALLAPLEKLRVRSAIIDLEAVVLAPDGHSDFGQLQRALSGKSTAPLSCYLLDLCYLDGFDVRAASLTARRELLRQVYEASPIDRQRIRWSESFDASGEQVFEHACRLGVEGIVSKRRDSTYRSGRSTAWLKIKCSQRQEFLIVGYLPGETRSNLRSLVMGYYDLDGTLVYAGRVGTGFSEAEGAELLEQLRPLVDAQPARSVPSDVDTSDVRWVRPALVAEVQFAEFTDAGLIRHGVFKGLREDKLPSDVRRDEAYTVIRSRRGSWTQGERPLVQLSNPDKKLYPAGVTKLDVVKYALAAAPYLLPHVAGRPLALLRCPDGIAGDCFFQKHDDGQLPEAVQALDVNGKDGRPAMTIDSIEGLLALIQMGTIELHPWGCFPDYPEIPDRLVFDLDPDETLPFAEVKQAAWIVRERLQNDGLETFVAVTGGKGIHVVAPIDEGATWEAAYAYAKSVAEALAREDNQRFVATMKKSRREGRIFIDYLRNRRGATTAAPYSMRARAGAPAHMPLEWVELADIESSGAFPYARALSRLEALGEDPWQRFFEVQQRLPS